MANKTKTEMVDEFDDMEDMGGDEPGEDEAQPKVRRELNADAIAEREQQLAQHYMEVSDLKERHLARAQKVRTIIREKESVMQRLATEIKERAEWVPAQLELAGAVAARDAAVRGTKRPGAERKIK